MHTIILRTFKEIKNFLKKHLQPLLTPTLLYSQFHHFDMSKFASYPSIPSFFFLLKQRSVNPFSLGPDSTYFRP